ncbi:ulp1 protease family, C-terminal catalytic domain-containing protein [Tanacetum coccineum]|uniref:Ulp1 protease family, C-terminal catalytic domain-containing protein n=1 Tax=Tanacetum coccineum TaxID=301880 RepID=A0ABQ5CQU6_9ASTR
MSSHHCTSPVLLFIYNLPLWLCMKRKYSMMSLLIQGPKQPSNDIDIYLKPLIEDMQDLWSNGVEVYDAYKKETFQMRAMSFCTISDFSAYGNLSGYKMKGKMACRERLQVRHCLDVMHIEKNVCESLLGLLLNIPGKTKDGVKVRKDMEAMNIRPELAPREIVGKTIKVPSGYSANIKKLVSMQDLKLFGMKSHDCHVLMTQMIPIAIREILPDRIRHTITKLCLFFSRIHSKVIDPEMLDQWQRGVILTICQLEMYFPPSFFDVMVHLVSHIVREIKTCGPTFLRNMYLFERYMGILKGYVRNRSRPEGSIIEGYATEEAIEFYTEYSKGVKTVGKPQVRHEMVTSRGSSTTHDMHCTIHIRAQVTLETPKQSKGSFGWLTTSVNFSQLSQKTKCRSTLTKVVKVVGRILGICQYGVKYEGYVINGYTFYTKEQDDKSTLQNSGVTIIASTTELSTVNREEISKNAKKAYYGVIQEIWELHYNSTVIPLFKCKWVDNEKGVNVDEDGFTTVNLSTYGYKSEPFILARLATQVFYVGDPNDQRLHVVLYSKRNIVGVENVVDEDEYNQFDELPPFSVGITPSNDVLDDTTYLRSDHDEGLEDDNELALVDPPKRQKRGPSKLKDKPKEPFNVEFNDDGFAIGKHQNDWSTYVGGMARLRISILDDDWSQIKQDHFIFHIKQEYFDLKDNDRKESTLTQCNFAWKRFKTYLKAKYMIPNKKPYEKKEYSFLEKKDWEEFCRKHRSPQNMKKQAIGKVYAKQQTNYARLGRSGYRGMNVDLSKVVLDEALKEEILNITCDRTGDWILARITSPNISTDMEELFRKLVDVDKKMAQGLISKEKGADPLIVVLGPEHGGRTRTVGNGIGFRKGIKGYKQSKRRNQSTEEIEAIVDRKLAQRDAERDTKRDAQRDAERDAARDAARDATKEAEIEVESENVETEASNEGRSQKRLKQNSCESTTVVHQEQLKDIKVKEPKSCMLFSPYTEDKKPIARGMVYPIGDGTIHGGPLLPYYMKVSIDSFVPAFGGTKLPVPSKADDTITLLEQSVGSFFQWPRCRISRIVENTPTSKDKASQRKGATLETTLATLNPVVQETTPLLSALQIPTLLETQQTEASSAAEDARKAKKDMEKKLDDLEHVIFRKQQCVQDAYTRWTSRDDDTADHVFEVPGGMIAGHEDTFNVPISTEDIMKLWNLDGLNSSILLSFEWGLCKMLQSRNDNRCGFLNPCSIEGSLCCGSYHVDKWRKCNQQQADHSGYYVMRWMYDFVNTHQIHFPKTVRIR